MKSTLKTLSIGVLSALTTLVAYDYLSNEKIEIVENEKAQLIPTTYSFNSNKVAAEMTDFTEQLKKQSMLWFTLKTPVSKKEMSQVG